MSEYLGKLTNFSSMTTLEEDSLNLKITDSLKEQEMNLLYGDLKKCQNVALILPDNLCYRQATTLKRMGVKHVNIGYFFAGWIPRNVPVRLGGLTASGLWNWWAHFLNATLLSKHKVSETETIPTPNLRGNILIIFISLWSGSLVSFICFVLECRYKIYQHVF